MASNSTAVGRGQRAPQRGPIATLITVVFLLPVGLTLLLLSRGRDNRPGMRELADPAQRTAQRPRQTPSASPDATTAPKPNRRTTRVRVPEVLESQPVPPPLSPLPASAEIPIGTHKSELLAAFVKPNMITTGVEQGQATEVLVYLHPDAGTQTVVKLRSGRVVETATAAY